MPSLHALLPWLAPAAGILGLLWSFLVHAGAFGKSRRTLLREEDLSDWLLADIGWKDGRDTTARRMAERCNRLHRRVL